MSDVPKTPDPQKAEKEDAEIEFTTYIRGKVTKHTSKSHRVDRSDNRTL